MGLEKTIQSVITQTTDDFEYLVIDGNSDDSSVEIIKKYTDKISWWISEPDAGIYNAMNKGIKKAQGDYYLFLNSGDWLIENKTLENVFKEIDGTADIYYSNRIGTDGYLAVYPDILDVNQLIKVTISHQNAIIKRTLFFTHGFYNEKLIISSDWEHFLKESWIYHSKFVHVSTNIAIVDTVGISNTDHLRVRAERLIVYKNVFGELADTIIENANYRETIYSDIIKHWGNSRLLDFILKVYRYIIRRLKNNAS
jgi:glycosyltransferase involved in cell wall biosynthesis